jgi:hypothetical protein
VIPQRQAIFSMHKDAGKIETETVHSHPLHPPLETPNKEPRNNGMIAIDRQLPHARRLAGAIQH